MSADLQDLFDQAARNPPAATWDADAVLRLARRSHNRRVTASVAAIVALTLVMLVGGLASHRLLSADPAPAAPRPTPAPAPIPQVPGSLGKLAYVRDGDVYLADSDGSNPVRIADGAPPDDAGGCDNYWAEGPMWSPDGRYLVYRGPLDAASGGGCLPGGGVIISDPNGRRLASFPAEGWSVAWSPDSSKVAVWVSFGVRIGIFGLDGAQQTWLPLPPDCSVGGDYDPVWSPDAASLFVAHGCQIPVDGSSPPQTPPPGDPRSQPFAHYSPDGTALAFFSPDGLAVGDVDGSHPRVLVRGAQLASIQGPLWSASGDRIAFVSRSNGGPAVLRVVDVASGAVALLADMRATADLVGGAIRFSPEGDEVLFARPEGNSGYSLWSVRTDGSKLHRLVRGAGWGDWQKLIPPH